MSNHTDLGITCFLKNWFIVLSFEDQNNCYNYLQAKWVKNCDQVSHTGEKQTQANKQGFKLIYRQTLFSWVISISFCMITSPNTLHDEDIIYSFWGG